MRKSMVIAQTQAGPLLGGLDWRLFLDGGHSMRALKELAAMGNHGATHYTPFQSNGRVLYGLYSAHKAHAMSKPPKDAVAAAACFANLVGQQAPNAALVLPVQSADVEGQDVEPQYLVVVLEEGVPLVDAVLSETAVRDTIGSDVRPMWAFDEAKYPGCEIVDHTWLVQGATPSAKVRRVPRNPWPAVILVGLTAVAFAVSWGYRNVAAAEPISLEAGHATY